MTQMTGPLSPTVSPGIGVVTTETSKTLNSSHSRPSSAVPKALG